jgi:galactokinase
MKKVLISETSILFTETFGSEPEHIFMSPGRINIIGEHVDYNNGYVLPAAIDKYICFAVSKSGSSRSTIIAKDLKDRYSFSIDDDIKPVQKMWANYILGVLSQIKEKYTGIQGFNIVFSSDIPIGAGLSSSAALECGFGYAIDQLFGIGISKKELALMGQQSEHTFVGVKCGIMDQFASVFGKEGKVIKLDCDSLDYEYHDAHFNDYSVLLMDSQVKHTHLTSGYNDRRQEVEAGLQTIKENYPEVSNFRGVTPEMIRNLRQELGEVNYRRCLFVTEEIQRVQDAVAALENSDIDRLGQLMFETHEGLSNQYEVSCDELDFLVTIAKDDRDVIGARMMGGGFGGCSINLVRKGKVDEFVSKAAELYHRKFGIELKSYQVAISEGTHEYKI